MFGAPSVVAASSLAVPNMLHFVYGTLMCPDVLMELCGRVPTLVPGVLNGFRRYQVPDHVYPAIVPDERPESCVNGLLVCGLDEIDVAVFDNFEGDEYIKAAVQVQVPKEKHGVPPGLHNAYVYVWKPKPGQPLVDPWSYEETFLPHLRDYLIMTKEFRDSLVDIPRSKLK